MNEPESWLDCSQVELAYLALNGSYGQKLIVTRYLETLALDPCLLTPDPCKQPFPKGRWTV